ncbi:MAG: DUF1553 domain-containing protein [Planctomycetota bacterium]
MFWKPNLKLLTATIGLAWGLSSFCVGAAAQDKSADLQPSSQRNQNLIINGKFRNQDVIDGRPDPWFSSNWGGEPIFRLEKSVKKTGRYSLSIRSENGANASWSQKVKVDPNSVYKLSAWVKTELVDKGSGFGVVVNMHELGFEGKSKGLSGNHDWTLLEVEANSGNHQTLLINMTFGGWGNATGQAWFDDIEFVKIKGPENLGPMTEDQAIGFYREKVKPILAEHCFDCHASDPEDLGGSLALTSRASILRGGDSGPAVDVNSPTESLLLRAVNYEVYQMPPDGKLSDKKINVLRNWVRLGMPFAPEDEKDIVSESHSDVPQVNEETKQWWSFQKVKRPDLPVVKHNSWPSNPIDLFVLNKLEDSSLRPAPPANLRALARRAYYDLTGLPPTPEQVEAFVNDPAPDAYPKLIDRLLASPQYGEKWGRHWLDLVRYAESNSFERDGTKPFVWRYRDYVIRSFNADKPYDQFLIEQLAGDEVKNPTQDSIIATGYYRLGQWDDEPADPLLAKFDDLDDIVATTSQTMLGLTVNCARCHDHKIDPIPTKDYYRMVSFFENIKRYGVRSQASVEANSIEILLGGEATEAEKVAYQKEMTRLERRKQKIVAKAKPDFEDVEHEDFQYEMNQLPILRKRIGKQITKREFEDFKRSFKKQKELIANPPGSKKILCVKESGTQPQDTFVRIRGNAHVKGDKVEPAFISVLSPPEPEIETPANQKSSGRRLAFAKWLTSPDNPMTARVMANRIWQYHFGRGIVRTASDFGFQGSKPTHPELLDWLAAEFVDQNWSIKAMHRLIMNSSAYKMSSTYSPEGYEIDPDNDLFWRFNLRRLTAEEIRDSILAVNRQLNTDKMFGPSVYPIMPKEVLAGQSRPGQNWGQSSSEDRRRRSIYIHVKRSLSLPILSTNDSADTDNTCPVRFITTQPTQALGMMNSRFTNDQAKILADEISQQHSTLEDKIATALHRVTQRPPKKDEIEVGLNLIQTLIDQEDATPESAFEVFCLMALNLNEFVYVD